MDNSTVFFLFIGLALLLGSGKYLVDSSVAIAHHFKIPSIIIGLTIVAFGTSAPELLVSVQAALDGHPDMAMGNVIGSNISNILLVLAMTTIIFPLFVKRVSIVRDWPIMMGISILLYVFVLDLHLSRLEGLIFVGLLLGYIVFSIWQSKTEKVKEEQSQKHVMKWWVALIILVVSCIGLAFGADLLVNNAAEIAVHLGISERVISISMVAIGTSLPELATSLIAAFKKETDISIGNIIGSNIMNVISVLGITSLIKPIEITAATIKMDLPWMIGASILLLLFMIPARRGKINRLEGSIMLLCYASYIYFIFMA